MVHLFINRVHLFNIDPDDIVGEEGVKILNQFRDNYGIDY